MGRGMAMTSGVSMNGWDLGAIGGCPASDRFWFRMAPHELAAGDQTTGRGPFVPGSGQPSASSCMASPDALLWMRTNTHPLRRAAELSLNRDANVVSNVIFSEDTAMSTGAQPLGTLSSPWL